METVIKSYSSFKRELERPEDRSLNWFTLFVTQRNKEVSASEIFEIEGQTNKAKNAVSC